MTPRILSLATIILLTGAPTWTHAQQATNLDFEAGRGDGGVVAHVR